MRNNKVDLQSDILADEGTRSNSSAILSSSALGGWLSDGNDLPAYRFTASVPLKTLDGSGKSYPLDTDPFFILGNYRVTVFPKVSGLYQLMSGERGWTRLNEPLPGAGQNCSTLELNRNGQSRRMDLLGLAGVCADSKRSTRQFGCGYARYTLIPDSDTRVVRTLSLAPSKAADPGLPAMIITVKITNTGTGDCDFVYTESILARVVLNIDLHTPEAAKVVRFTNQVKTDTDRSFVISHATAQSDDPCVLRPREDANRYNLYPPSLILAYPENSAENKLAQVEFGSRDIAPGASYLDASVRGHLAQGESRTLTFVIGLCPDQSPDEILKFARGLENPEHGVYFGRDWKSVLNTFHAVRDPVFHRELVWNCHALLSMATYNSFYDETFIPQGMTYDYQMDLTAAPRDHLQHAMAAAYFCPSLAKSTIRYVLCKMTEQGEIKYTDYGFGKTSNSAWNTSDQQLYLFQSLGEYLRITGDYAFLDEETTYLPHQAGMKGSVLEKIERALMYLRDEVGTGPHGLIRLMNSDWSDMVFADRSVLKNWSTAESHMNTTMAMAVIPNMIRQLESYAKIAQGAGIEAADRLVRSLNLYNDRISKAFYADLGERKFSTRLYFDAATPFGNDNLHIEPQSHLLQTEDFPVERKRILWDEIQKRILDGEVVGPRQRETPVEGSMIGRYVSENGGYWFSLGGQMITGLATFDKEAALSLLRMMTFDNFAKNYPAYWTGLWSGADTINAAPSAGLAGLPRPDNDGVWTSFASFCAHAHAWPIYAWCIIMSRFKTSEDDTQDGHSKCGMFI